MSETAAHRRDSELDLQHSGAAYEMEGLAPGQLASLLHSLQAMRRGDFSVRMTETHDGMFGKVADTFNDIVSAAEDMSKQLEKVGQVVGREGKIRQRVKVTEASGAWGEMEDSVNTLIDDLLWPT